MKTTIINTWSFDNRISMDYGFLYSIRSEIVKIALKAKIISSQTFKRTFLYSFWQILYLNPDILMKGSDQK